MKRSFVFTFSLILILFIVTSQQFSYLFNYDNTVNGVFVVTHSPGYTGAGASNLPITVGVDPTSQVSNIADLRTPVLNNILIWNLQFATTSNTGSLADFSKYDLESVTLHEMGHSLGIAHSNLASESLLTPPLSEGTAAYAGVNGVYDVNPGVDSVYGSADDQRGDDLNYFFFNPSNNPFVLTTPIDKSTYKNSIAFLPQGDSFATCGGLAESALLLSKKRFNNNMELFSSLEQIKNRTAEEEYFYQKMLQNSIGRAKQIERSRELCSETPLHHKNHQERARTGTTEAIMQQGTFNGEFQRQLTADDVAAIKYSQTGLDETLGTSDDYSFRITYAGDTTGNTIDVFMDPSFSGFGVSQSSAFALSGFHYALDTALIRLNPTVNWFFNPLLATVLTFPSSQSQSIIADQKMSIDLYFASSGPSVLSTSDFTYVSSVGGTLLLIKKQTYYYTIEITGFSGAGNPCLSFTSTTKTDSAFGATYDVSNQVCFVTIASSPSVSPTVSVSPSSSISAALSLSPSQTISTSITPTISVSTSATATVSVTSSVTPTTSFTPSVTPTTSFTPSVTATTSLSPSVTATTSLSPSITPTTSVTPSVTPTASLTPSITPSLSVTSTTSPSLGPTLSNSLSRSSSTTATVSATPSSSFSQSPSATKSISITPTISTSSSISESISITPSRTKTPVVFESIPVSLAPTVTKSPSLSISPEPSESAKRSNTPSVSETPKKSKTPTSSITPLPSISAHQRPTDETLTYFTSLSCTKAAIECCASFINEWSALSAINDVNLVRIVTCQPRGNVIDITYEQSGSQKNSATAVMKSYFKLAVCGANVEDVCYPLPGSLNTDSWDYVFILSPSGQVQSFSYTTVALPTNPPPYYVYYDFTSFVGSSLLGKYQSSGSSVLEVGIAFFLPVLTLLFSLVMIV